MWNNDAEKYTLEGTLSAFGANHIIHKLRLQILKIIYNFFLYDVRSTLYLCKI